MAETRLFPRKDYSKNRSDQKTNFKRKVLIAFEGGDTEPNYFELIKSSLEEKSANLVEVVPLHRKDKDGASHPKNIRDGMIEYFNLNKATIDKNDSLWIVIDVDRHFGSKDDVIKTAYLEFLQSLNFKQEYKILAAVSMPCFELWLILHYEEAINLDIEKIRENKKITKQRYIKKYYKLLKTTHQIDITERVEQATEQAKSPLLENKVENLCLNVGTSVYQIIEDVLRK